MEGDRGSPWTRLPVLLLLACAATVGECRVVHVGEAHRRSMLANGLGSTPPMGYELLLLLILLLKLA